MRKSPGQGHSGLVPPARRVSGRQWAEGKALRLFAETGLDFPDRHAEDRTFLATASRSASGPWRWVVRWL